MALFCDPLQPRISEPLAPRRPARTQEGLDIAPMIDVTFLLLIFFMVASLPDVHTALELPPAQYGKGVSRHTSVIVTIAGRGQNAEVYLADGKLGLPLDRDPAAQQALIRAAVEEGFHAGKKDVLIKAEKAVLHRHVARVAAAAASVEGVKINLAVFEID